MLEYAVAMQANPMKPEEPRKAYAYLQTRGVFDIDALADHMVAHGCPYDRADIVATITKLVSCCKEVMLDGFSISLGDLGRFHLTCRSEGAASLRDFDRTNIKEIRVRFKASKQFNNLLGHASLHKTSTRKFADLAYELQMQGYSAEEIMEIIEQNQNP